MVKIPTMTTQNNDDDLWLICSLCKDIISKQGALYFMDDPNVIKAIKPNDPLALKKLTDSFIGDALCHIIQLLSEGNSK